MRLLFAQLDQISQRLFNRSFGWTGIEIGCHAIHMAQVRKLDDSWQLAALWTLEHAKSNPTELGQKTLDSDETFGWLAINEVLDQGLSGTLDRMENLHSLFQGRQCAATLTDGMIAYRELDLPSSELSESKAMVRSEIALETESELEELLTDCWDLPQGNPRAGTSCFGAVSIRRSAALRVASDLLQAGFECQTLDAMPCAMARSTSIMVKDANVSILAVDLGYYQATLTLVKAGQPLLSRGVRGLGMMALLEQIASSFEISLSDAKTLLFQSTPNQTAMAKATDGRSNPVHQQLGSFLQSLSNEVDKTIQFANRTYRFATPSQLLLMGAGTRIPSVDHSVSERIGLPTNLWAINLSENLFGNQHTATFAIAAGLSALAWEAM